MENYQTQGSQEPKRSGRGIINLLLIIVIIGGVVFAMWRVGIIPIHKAADDATATTVVVEDEQPVAEEKESNEPSVVEQQQAEIEQLRSEIKELKKEIKEVKKATAAKSEAKPSKSEPAAAKAAKAAAAPATVDAKAVTLVSYTHTWSEENAKISLKNNTEQTITKISARITYYDMSGNMLDYQDFTKSVQIDPGMSRSLQIPGFGADEHYAYYKSDTFYSQQRKYKVQFQLKSYTVQ